MSRTEKWISFWACSIMAQVVDNVWITIVFFGLMIYHLFSYLSEVSK